MYDYVVTTHKPLAYSNDEDDGETMQLHCFCFLCLRCMHVSMQAMWAA